MNYETIKLIDQATNEQLLNIIELGFIDINLIGIASIKDIIKSYCRKEKSIFREQQIKDIIENQKEIPFDYYKKDKIVYSHTDGAYSMHITQQEYNDLVNDIKNNKHLELLSEDWFHDGTILTYVADVLCEKFNLKQDGFGNFVEVNYEEEQELKQICKEICNIIEGGD